MLDIANYAGVYKTSVSRVVNGLPESNETYQKVSAAMQSLGYHLNLLARALATRRNTVTGVIISESLTSNSTVSDFLSQLLEKMSELKKPVIAVQNKGGLDSMLECYHTLAEQRCEDIIFLGVTKDQSTVPASMMDELRERDGIPIVVIQSYQAESTRIPQNKNETSLTITNAFFTGSETRHKHIPIDGSINQTISYFNNAIKVVCLNSVST